MFRPFLAIATAAVALAGHADVEVSTPSLIRHAPHQTHASVASSGSDFLAAWVDSTEFDIRAVRVAADGTIVDALPLKVSPAEMQSTDDPSVIWNGSEYLVAWDSSARSYVATVSRDGLVGAPQRLFQSFAYAPALASSAAGTVAIATAQGGLAIATLDRDGHPTAEHALGSFVNKRLIAPVGDDFLIAWRGDAEGRRGVVAAIVSSHGDVVVAPHQLGSEDGDPVAVAGNGDQALVVYDTAASIPFALGGATDLVGRILTHTTTSAAIPIASTAEPAIRDASIAVDHGSWVVAWMQMTTKIDNFLSVNMEIPAFTPLYDIERAVVTSDGSVVPAPPFTSSSDISDEQPAMASNGANVLLVWSEESLIPSSPIMRIAGAFGPPSAPAQRLDLARSAPRQTTPRIATAADVALAVWSEDTNNDSGRAIFARRMKASGEFLDAAPVRIADASTNSFPPSLAASRDAFVVLWVNDSFRTVVQRIATDGTLLDPQPLDIGRSDQQSPVATSNGEDFAFIHVENSSAVLTILKRSGALEQHVVAHDQTGADFQHAELAWDGSAYVAVWSVSRLSGDVFRQQVVATRIDANGTVITAETTLAAAPTDQFNPSIACADGSCVIAWIQFPAIATARLTANTIENLGSLQTGTFSVLPHVRASAGQFTLRWLSGNATAAGETIMESTIATRAAAWSRPTTIAGPLFGPVDFDFAFDAAQPMLVYSTPMAASGDVERVFVRPTAPPRRRSVRP